MKSVLAIALFFLTFNLSITSAQSPDCGSGLPQRLVPDGRGWNNTAPPGQAIRIRSAPNGDQVGTLAPGDTFTVTGDAECAANLSWWPITTDAGTSGWIAEGVNGGYFVEMLDAPQAASGAGVGSDAQRNFVTSIELQPTAPIVGGTEQISMTGSTGGGIDFEDGISLAELYHYGDTISFTDIKSFAADEQVLVTIYAPDGSVYREETVKAVHSDEGNALNVHWLPTLHDLDGTWRIHLKGEDGREFDYTTRLEPYDEPTIHPICDNGEYTLIFEGFTPNEPLVIEMVEAMKDIYLTRAEFAYEVKSMMSWAVNADERGQLVVTFSDSILRSNLRYFVIYNQFGRSWGADIHLQAGQQWFSFDTCLNIAVNVNDIDTSLNLQPPFIYGERIDNIGEHNYFTFEAQSGQTLDIKMEKMGDDTSTMLDAGLQLLAPDGTIIAENDDSDDMPDELDAHIADFSVPETGIYTIVADGREESFGPYKLIVKLDGIGDGVPNLEGASSPFAHRNGGLISRPASRDEALYTESVWDRGQPFKDSTTPTTQNYDVTVSFAEPVRVTFTWCADTASRLQEILQPLTLTFRFNGTDLPENAFLRTDTSNCRYWDALLTFLELGEKSEFEIRYTLSEDIFDGTSTYKAGEYVHLITINTE